MNGWRDVAEMKRAFFSPVVDCLSEQEEGLRFEKTRESDENDPVR